MSETQVTGGLVSVEDGIKASEEYAPARKVRVELSFSIAESTPEAGRADIISLVADQAAAQVARLLGRGSAPQATVREVTPAPEEAAAPKKTRRTAAQIAEDKAAAGPPAGGATPSPSDLSAIPDDGPGEQSAPSAESPADLGGVTDEWEVPAEVEVEVVTVTDADLNALVQKRNGELGDPVKIRTLIGKFNPDPTKPFQLRQIPADQRAQFVADLNALVK